MTRFLPFIAALTVATAASSVALGQGSSWNSVAEALGKSGTETNGVYRVGLPRSDLHVTLDGVTLKPTFALGSWVAFEGTGDNGMAMGDLVLTETEIEPVMKKLQDGGIEITALHNHLLRAQPATFYMHVQGHGDPLGLARAIHNALMLSGTPFGNPQAGGAPPALGLDTAAIDRIIGVHGQNANGVYQLTVPRADTVRAHGMAVPPAMGTGESINFQPTGNGKAAITGDFVLTAAEVTPVMRTLRDNGIDVMALHNHMLDDQPRMFFMHFWANDDAPKLATGLRAALDKVHVAAQGASQASNERGR
jgi:biotin operon repressor